MYEELLPTWKAVCKKTQRETPKGGMRSFRGWPDELERKGFYMRGISFGRPENPEDVRGEWEWVENSSGEWDCLVCGVMLFTWEAGIAE